jgi:hypothetical protein
MADRSVTAMVLSEATDLTERLIIIQGDLKKDLAADQLTDAGLLIYMR